MFNSSLGVIFSAKKYADELWKVCKSRDININLKTNLVEVKPTEKIALFQNLDKPNEAPTSVKVR